MKNLEDDMKALFETVLGAKIDVPSRRFANMADMVKFITVGTTMNAVATMVEELLLSDPDSGGTISATLLLDALAEYVRPCQQHLMDIEQEIAVYSKSPATKITDPSEAINAWHPSASKGGN